MGDLITCCKAWLPGMSWEDHLLTEGHLEAERRMIENMREAGFLDDAEAKAAHERMLAEENRSPS